MLLLAGVVVYQLANLQLTPSARYVAESQRARDQVLPADRGELLDRYGSVLALDAPTQEVVVDPKVIADEEKTVLTAQVLAPVLGLVESEVLAKLNKGGRYAVLTADRTDDLRVRVADAIKVHDLVGVVVRSQPARRYPGGDLARSVLGKASIDLPDGGRTEFLQGHSGLESQLDATLRGRPGVLRSERNPKKQVIAAGATQRVPAVRGTSYVLTLDRVLSHDVEQMLLDAVELTNARAGVVLIGDPKTGDILVNANVLGAQGTSPARVASYNIAATERFEPGSVMKPITISAALEEGVTTVGKQWWTPDTLLVADHTFTDDVPHPEQMWTPSQILQNSSNIGTIRIAQALKRDRLVEYLDRYGFGRRTEVGFPDEVRGRVPQGSDWSGTSIGAVPIGQEVGVSTLQVLSLYNTLANDGIRVPLRLVRGTVDGQGRRHDQAVAPGSKVISAETSHQMRTMLTAVVDGGTGANATVTGFSVAGKTGTGQIARNNGSGYYTDRYIADFAGFFPASAPKLSIVVVLFEPTPYYGGKVAAPLFADVARAAAVRYRIAPDRAALAATASGGVIVQAPFGLSAPATRAGILGAQARIVPAPATTSAAGSTASRSRPASAARTAGPASVDETERNEESGRADTAAARPATVQADTDDSSRAPSTEGRSSSVRSASDGGRAEGGRTVPERARDPLDAGAGVSARVAEPVAEAAPEVQPAADAVPVGVNAGQP